MWTFRGSVFVETRRRVDGARMRFFVFRNTVALVPFGKRLRTCFPRTSKGGWLRDGVSFRCVAVMVIF
jgi:hypothetical protein